jgi:hypothetical protein
MSKQETERTVTEAQDVSREAITPAERLERLRDELERYRTRGATVGR